MKRPDCIQENELLAPHTTLGVGGNAAYYAHVQTPEEARTVVQWAHAQGVPVVPMGDGSNVLFADEGTDSLVMHVDIRGVAYARTDERVSVTVGAGVLLDELIVQLVDDNVWGLENLSGIPGTVGATPVQNVGAYGVEVADVLTHVEVYDMDTDTFCTLTNAQCAFGYRDSLFKTESGKRYCVTSVTFSLSLHSNPQCTSRDLATRFTDDSLPALSEIRAAVLEIRRGKFPDWQTVGTAGSFFKNPIVDVDTFETLKATYPDLPGFYVSDTAVKVPLGYVLDEVLNLKGYRSGNVGLYEKQALVLISHGGATAREITQFARDIGTRVMATTGIDVEWEVTYKK